MSPAPPQHDNGFPSESILKDTQRVLKLVVDERHLSAESLWKNVQERIKSAPQATSRRGGRLLRTTSSVQQAAKAKEIEVAKNLIASNRDVLNELKVSQRFCRNLDDCLVTDGLTHTHTILPIATLQTLPQSQGESLQR